MKINIGWEIIDAPVQMRNNKYAFIVVCMRTTLSPIKPRSSNKYI